MIANKSSATVGKTVVVASAIVLGFCVAWAQNFPCQGVVPTCPENGAQCGPANNRGTWEVSDLRYTYYYACNGRRDCGQGLPGSQCNIMTRTVVRGATVRCTTSTYPPGACITWVGETTALNTRCDNYQACDPAVAADVIPNYELIYQGNTGGTFAIPPKDIAPPPGEG